MSKALAFTYEDYRHFPEDKRYEIVDGEVYMVPSPITKHQSALLELASLLRDFVMEKDLGKVFVAPYDVILSDTDVVQPDILFVSTERAGYITEENLRGAPDLAIEILSSHSEYRDRVIKRKLYGKHGVREYWIVGPEQKTIEVLTLSAEGHDVSRLFFLNDELVSPLLPGLTFSLKEVFREK